MRILHLSDLHLGKRLFEFSLIEEQRDILNKITGIIDREKIDCVIISGDIYDKSLPPAEAVSLFDDFLFELSSRQLHTFVISGNHDSPERIAFGGRIMSGGGIYMSPVYSGSVEPVTLRDDHGEINFYMLPFVKPLHVRRYFPECGIDSYNDAVAAAVAQMNIDVSKRNILITHQFITGAVRSESEEFFVGGTENVDADLFADFDYTALGHIHRPQNIGKNIRYCGTPLKYSLSEVSQEKSVTVVEAGEKGSLEIRSIPLVPLRDVREYKGSFEKLSDKQFYGNINTDDYIFITLTDEEDIPDAVRKLRKIYPHMVKLRYDNSRTQLPSVISETNVREEIPPTELFVRFYEQQNNHSMNDDQLKYISSLIDEVWKEEIL